MGDGSGNDDEAGLGVIWDGRDGENGKVVRPDIYCPTPVCNAPKKETIIAAAKCRLTNSFYFAI